VAREILNDIRLRKIIFESGQKQRTQYENLVTTKLQINMIYYLIFKIVDIY